MTASAATGGASRPEKRVTARSRPCQNRWTGLVLPLNQPLNSSSTRSVQSSAARKRSTYSRSQAACSWSAGNGVVIGRPNGTSRMSTSMPSPASTRVQAPVELRHVEPLVQPEALDAAVGRAHDEGVVDEVEADVERRAAVVEPPRRETPDVD